MMSTLRAVGIDEMNAVVSSLLVLGATVYPVTVLGSVGGEYAYEIPYEAEGDDESDWMWTAPRVTEFPDLNATEEYTKEWEAA